MKKKSLLILISGLVGLVTASLYAARIQNVRDEIVDYSQRTPVLTVNRNIRIGEALAVEDLSETFLLKKQLSGRTILPGDLELIIGRRVIHPIPAKDPILWTDFSEGPRVRRPTEMITPGYRVIALPADEVRTLIHFISPGDSVDIVSTEFDNIKDRVVCNVLAEDVIVLAVGHQMDSKVFETGKEDYPVSVSLMINPQTALAILRAVQKGEIYFLARGSDPIARNYIKQSQNYSAIGHSGEIP